MTGNAKYRTMNLPINMSLQFYINIAIFPISDDFYTRKDLIAQEPCRIRLGVLFMFDFCFLTDEPH